VDDRLDFHLHQDIHKNEKEAALFFYGSGASLPLKYESISGHETKKRRHCFFTGQVPASFYFGFFTVKSFNFLASEGGL